MQVAEEVSERSNDSRETAGLVDEDSALCGRGEEDLAGGGGVETVDQALDSASNPDSLDPKSIAVSSTESLATAATTTPEAVLVKAGPSGARVADYDDEEMRLRAEMKAAALELASDDEEVVPAAGMRPNAWVNRFGIN